MQYKAEELTPWAYGDPPMDGVWQRRYAHGARYAKRFKGLWYISSESIEMAASEWCVANQLVKYTVPWRGLKNKP